MEIWKDIENYEGKYQVSNLGRVKRIPCKHRHSEQILIGQIKYNGYRRVCLSHLGTQHHFSIHRLVAIAFISNPENKELVNHKNGIKDDNREENLEWVTAYENNIDSRDNGYRKANIINVQTAKQIREMYGSGMRQCEISRRLNINHHTIHGVLKRGVWGYK